MIPGASARLSDLGMQAFRVKTFNGREFCKTLKKIGTSLSMPEMLEEGIERSFMPFRCFRVTGNGSTSQKRSEGVEAVEKSRKRILRTAFGQN